MTSMELMPYTETRRDQVEADLAAAANRREINYRESGTYRIYAFWLVKENVCLIYIEDKSNNTGVEYQVPNNEMGSWLGHELAHRDANFPHEAPNE